MRRIPAFCLALALCLAACSGPATPDRPGTRAEEEALRARVEKLEREDAAERQRLAGELRALRQELEGLRRSLEEPPADRGAAPGQSPSGQPNPPGQPGPEAQKSPRQALKESLKGFVDLTRQTLDRLSRELDESLVRPPAPGKGQEKAPDRKPAPPAPAGPDNPATPGTQI